MFEFVRAWKKLIIPLLILMGILIFGTLGYKILYPDIPIIKLIYMTGITISTVGYGDILNIENNNISIIYTMILILLGMAGVLYSTSALTAYIIEGNLKNAFVNGQIRRRIKKMKNHYIICGIGETGIHVIREMKKANQDFVVIDYDDNKREELYKEFPRCNIITGDATSDDILNEAEIKKAKGIIATLGNDKDNLFLVLSARILCPSIDIAAKAINLSMIEKLKKAGAKKVISPNYIGGTRLASEILRPNVISFIDQLWGREKSNIRLDELTLPLRCHLDGKTLKDANIFNQTGINVIALKKSGDDFLYNPPPSTKLYSGDILLYIADDNQERALESFIERT